MDAKKQLEAVAAKARAFPQSVRPRGEMAETRAAVAKIAPTYRDAVNLAAEYAAYTRDHQIARARAEREAREAKAENNRLRKALTESETRQ